MTYEIRDIGGLETSTQELANSNQKVSADVTSLEYIINQIKENWQNDAGTDLASIINELESCISKLKNAINPTVSKYVDTMNTLVAESKSIQQKTA